MHEIKIGKNLFLTAEGIAVFRDLRLAAAADLHIGFEEALGEQLARIQTRLMLEKFLRVIGRFGIRELVLDGDIKYTFGKESRQEWKEIGHFMSELQKRVRLKIVKGNHDFYVENMVRDFDILVSKEFELNGILFAHGDEEIPPDPERKLLVIGNEHPSVRLRDEIGASRKYPCFLYAKEEKILVLPAANPWTYGTDVLGVQTKDFLSPPLRGIKLEEARLYPSDGSEIYDFKKVGDVRGLLKQ